MLGVNSNAHWIVFRKTESRFDVLLYFEIYYNINIGEKHFLRICNITRHIMSSNPEFNLKVIHCYRSINTNCLLPPSESIFHKSVKFRKNAKDGVICILILELWGPMAPCSRIRKLSDLVLLLPPHPHST